MWHTVYRESDGKLMGHGTSIPEVIKGGLVSIEHDDRQDQGNEWNGSTLQWDAIPASRKIPISDFFGLFTEDEMHAYSLSTSNNLQKVRRVIEDRKSSCLPIDKDTDRTDQMLDILVSEGIITEQRKGEILA